jgi:hypothetical protein
MATRLAPRICSSHVSAGSQRLCESALHVLFAEAYILIRHTWGVGAEFGLRNNFSSGPVGRLRSDRCNVAALVREAEPHPPASHPVLANCVRQPGWALPTGDDGDTS